MSAVKGNATEAAILGALAGRGFDLLVPFGGGQPYDLVVDLGYGTFLRVQCKTGRLVNECVVFNGRSSDHGHGRRTYAGLADVFGVFFPAGEAVYLVPVLPNFAPRLRLRPPRNNQRRGIRLASDYELSRWSTEALIAIAGGASDEVEARSQFA